MEATHPEGVFIVAVDFNQAKMKTVFPHFHQYMDFATRGKSTLGTSTHPHLGSPDHLSVMLSAYIQKCIEDVNVMKNITTRANKKPWMNSDLCAMLKARNVAFKSVDMMALGTTRANLNCAMRIAKRAHAHKVQDFFHDPPNTRRMWQSIQVLTDYKSTPAPVTSSIFSMS